MRKFNNTTTPNLSDSDEDGNIEIELTYLDFEIMNGYKTYSEIKLILWNNFEVLREKARKSKNCTFSGWRHTDKWLNSEINQIDTVPDKISSSESNLFVLANDKTLWYLNLCRRNEGWVQLPDLPKQNRKW